MTNISDNMTATTVTPPFSKRHRSAALIATAALLTGGCAKRQFQRDDFATSRPANTNTALQAQPTDYPTATNNPNLEVPVALINDEAVLWPEYRELLAETSGGTIIRELALDQMLRARLREQNKFVTKTSDEAEHQFLLASLSTNPDQAARLLQILRNRRDLGPRRFARLLRRNAMLRTLVHDDIQITEERLHIEYDRQFGPSYRIRLITLTSQTEAEALLPKLRRGELAFNETAAKISTDISAQRGGLLLPFSPKDESYPRILREVIPELLAGEISPVLPIDDQYAIIQMVEHVQASPARYENVRNKLMLDVLRFEERRAMDVLAQELLASAQVVILDPATSGAWLRGTTQ